jgi:hypothetical protein
MSMIVAKTRARGGRLLDAPLSGSEAIVVAQSASLRAPSKVQRRFDQGVTQARWSRTANMIVDE